MSLYNPINNRGGINMFWITNKETKVVRQVYSVNINYNNETIFLIHCFGQWAWVEADKYEPITQMS